MFIFFPLFLPHFLSLYTYIYALMRFYVAQIGSLLPMFRENLSVPSSRAKQFKSSWNVWPLKMSSIGCPEMWVTNYLRCVKSPKNVDLIYTAAKAWNHTSAWFVYSIPRHTSRINSYTTIVKVETRKTYIVLNLKLSPCSVCCMLSSG